LVAVTLTGSTIKPFQAVLQTTSENASTVPDSGGNNMRIFITIGLLCAALSTAASTIHAADSPYAGQDKRAIKALSEQEIGDYLNGRGMGTSKAAELNHYPGPRHVLDEADKLGLTAQQVAKTRDIHAAMESDAKRIGKEIVQKEMELESLYANQRATADNTRDIVTALARLQADFRLAHLNAHLQMRDILSPHQIAIYDQLRGYGGRDSHAGSHAHKH
jgi:Spy/CpxP family protein refolding chaperone